MVNKPDLMNTVHDPDIPAYPAPLYARAEDHTISTERWCLGIKMKTSNAAENI